MRCLISFLLVSLSVVPAFAAASSVATTNTYLQHSKAQAFINYMVKKHQFERSYLEKVIAVAEKKQPILDAIAKPAEKSKPWNEYRDIFIQKSRIEAGVTFWRDNQTILAEVEKTFGVPANIIVAIIGVETRYGQYMGSYRVVDALSTLGFDYPPRGEFFTRQLEEFFLMTREQKQDPLSLTGSYAGAMGYGQFIPSSYRSFAFDYDQDGFADIWKNKKDAIASVANYFKAHGWQYDQPVAEPAKRSHKFPEQFINTGDRPKRPAKELAALGFSPLSKKAIADRPAEALSYNVQNGQEYWLGYNNFYVITRYNRSRMYPLAVYQLSEAIADEYHKINTLKPA